MWRAVILSGKEHTLYMYMYMSMKLAEMDVPLLEVQFIFHTTYTAAVSCLSTPTYMYQYKDLLLMTFKLLAFLRLCLVELETPVAPLSNFCRSFATLLPCVTSNTQPFVNVYTSLSCLLNSELWTWIECMVHNCNRKNTIQFMKKVLPTNWKKWSNLIGQFVQEFDHHHSNEGFVAIEVAKWILVWKSSLWWKAVTQYIHRIFLVNSGKAF